MNRATYISSYLIYRDVNDEVIRAVSGALLNRLYLDQPIPRDKFAEVVYEEAIPLNGIPTTEVVKMARREHVDAFFRDGSLRLGNFRYYNQYDQEEIGDRQEGSFILVGNCPPTTAFVEIGGGFDNYIYCCFAGEPDPNCLGRFGYDAGMRIRDIAGFTEAVAEKIQSEKHWYSKCAYSRDKVVVGSVDADFDFGTISSRLLDLTSEAKYFVKPDKYAHQCEYRFVWKMPGDVTEPLDLKCPEAIQFCETL
ncbi:MAG: hypothetical protein U5R46_19870 [Gammaproteobacteria bacterium]|nr:hypothetical protein [Gammaproteobacteria bacterium]